MIDRLTRLSDEMDRCSTDADESAARVVASVSEDIQSTVTELKSILGESASGGDGDV